MASSSAAVPAIKAEDVLGKTWDRCISDTLIKMSAGLAIGGVFSLALFKRRAWPLFFGTGSGFGMGYANCQHEMGGAFQPAANTVQEKTTD